MLSLKMKDIIADDGSILDNQSFNNKFGLNVNEWKWTALKAAIPQLWRNKLGKLEKA